jgi:rhamnogalacturonan endolyase
MESLGRGVVAVKQADGRVFVGWRMLGTDAETIAFNLYRSTGGGKPVKLNSEPIADVTYYVDAGADSSRSNAYFVRPVLKNREQEASRPFTLAANAPARQYLSVPLQTPEGYTPNDASAGDLDGDGEYDIVLHQTGRGRDNGQAGMTTEPILEAYKLDGALLWRINLGKNIREGAHYTQFMVYDLDGDGRAEVACKTADGTIDGKGKVIGDAKADWRSKEERTLGKILSGPEYLTVFDGLTGAALATADYDPPRGDIAKWGDTTGNRVDRFLACVAYLDGKRPSLVMARGYYTRTVLAAWNWRGGKLSKVWTFDSDATGNKGYAGQGNHNLSVGDVDGDGRDEIIYGQCAIDDDGKGLYTTGLGHGDAMHLSDLDPTRPGLEVFSIQERFDDAGAHMVDAQTGAILWKKPSIKAGDDGEGPGRALALDIDPRHAGYEAWVRGAEITGLFNAKGEKISDRAPRSCNFGVYWDGDALGELLDRNRIAKWSWTDGTETELLLAEGSTSNNGTKATPALSADLFGDWREEVMWRTTDGKELRIYTTTIPTKLRFYTFMHDPQYRLSVAWQNVAYNQPPHTSFYMGEGMAKPPRPAISLVQVKR